ncbi:MAG: hypothetical protein DRO36_03915 [Candidatus Hecatellales archaeon]|nr:MAG: hypothetical protein DRO36_03915 [Candidatus Hecatellales archaeon]
MDSTLPEIVEFYSLIQTMKKTGVALIPQTILNYSTKKLYQTEKENLLKNWYNSGLWYGKFLKAKFENPTESLKKFLLACFWEITEIEISKSGDEKISLKIIAPSQTQENTELLLKFIDGIMTSLNYKILREEFWRGIIIMDLEKRKEPLKIELEEM